ncbi:MAG: DUF2157 domain-containing protein [Verrucomicrobiae bacterium]|nr:DUF2157 domain-containing protein [Verrucomicrobiae bacterium]
MNEKHVKWLLEQLPDLVSQGVIPADTAEKLRKHYSDVESGKDRAKRIAIILFSIIGSALIGGGIILLLAHNWDQLSRPLRAIVSITPLLLTQILGLWLILRDKLTTAWREGIGTFQTLALGSAIALVSQTYHLGGDLDEFLLTWSLLSLPLAYILKTTFTILLYLVGVTVWVCATQQLSLQKFMFFPLMALSIPFLYITIREKNKYHPRAMLSVLSFIITFVIGTFVVLNPVFKMYSFNFGWYLVIFSIVFLTGMRWYNEKQTIFGSPVQTIGASAILMISITLNFRDFWEHLFSYYGYSPFSLSKYFENQEFYTIRCIELILCVAFLSVYLILWLNCILKKSLIEIIFGLAPIVFIIAWNLTTNNNSILASAMFTLYLVITGLIILAKGLQQRQMIMVNFGMLIISTVIIIKFMETDISFVYRGLAFITIGIIFLLINLFLKRWKGAGQ